MAPVEPDPVLCEPWLVRDDLPCLPALAEEEELDPELAEKADRAILISTEVLWALSGRMYGPGCPSLVRPCSSAWCLPWRHPWQHPGGWTLLPCEAPGRTIDLLGPVYDVLAVTIDGVDVDPTTYRIDDGYRLVRLGGEPWPFRQDIYAPLTDPDTFGVRYRIGLPLGEAGEYASEVFSCELYLGLTGDKKCRLPRGTTGATRQGTSIEIDPAAFLAAGKTGLPEVDAWLVAANPAGLMQRSMFVNPDTWRRNRSVPPS